MSDDLELTVKRIIHADRETVFKALTDEHIMQKWFFAGEEGWGATVKNDPREGGNYNIDMHGANDTYRHNGTFKEVIPNEKLVFTWNSQAVQDTVVTITLAEVDGGTEVKLKHEFMPNEEMKKNHTEGWKQILQNLEKVVLN